MGKWCRKREEEKVNKGQVYQQKLCRDSGIWGGHWNRSPITAGMVWTRYKDKVHSGKMHCASSTFKSFTYAVKLQPTNTIPQHLITAKCYGNFIFLRNLHTVFHSDYTNLQSYQQCTRILFSPHYCWYLLIIDFLMIAILTNRKLYLIAILICTSLIISYVEHCFSCACWPLLYLLRKKII